MKILSREFWGTILICLGVAVFLIVVYNTVRLYLPSEPKRKTAKKPQTASKAPTAPRTAAPASKSDKLTSSVHQTKGNYNLWVWGVKPEWKTGETVQVEVAHAAAGEEGGFWIVAYADTNEDGKPDKEIAKSDYLTAQEAGGWSSLEFKTPEKSIFLGYTWPENSNTRVYRANGPWPMENHLEDVFYHTIFPLDAKKAGPAFTNLKFEISD